MRLEITCFFVFLVIVTFVTFFDSTSFLHFEYFHDPHSCFCRQFADETSENPSFTAIIVETRFGPPLIFAIRHMSCSLPDDWIIMLIAHVSMRANILAEFNDLLLSGKLRVWELSTTVRTLREICPDVESNEWCNPSFNDLTNVVESEIEASPWPLDWKLSNEIWFSMNAHQAIPTKYFLIFQTDGLLCKPLASTFVEELQQYDYIGAPWDNKISENGVQGNGGFSFRNRDVMKRILNPFKGQQFDRTNEDGFFSSLVQSEGGTLPPLDFAKAFSVESVPFNNPVGFHKPWKFLSRSDMDVLIDNCPVINERQTWNEPTSNQNSSFYIHSCEIKRSLNN